METRPMITLTTDYGISDGNVAALKGVIYSIDPRAQVADMVHDVPPFDIVHGAFVIGTSYMFFPKGTIHVGVVDPGVGTRRRPVLIQTVSGHIFIGPDNGLFSLVLEREKIRSIHELVNPKYFLPEVSRTFHGRDIFAPVAAHLARGVAAAKFGRRLQAVQRLDMFSVQVNKNSVSGQVIHLDHFGNVVTSIPSKLLKENDRSIVVQVKGHSIRGLSGTFGEVSKGAPLAYAGSSGYLELALCEGSLATRWDIQRGAKISVTYK